MEVSYFYMSAMFFNSGCSDVIVENMTTEESEVISKLVIENGGVYDDIVLCEEISRSIQIKEVRGATASEIKVKITFTLTRVFRSISGSIVISLNLFATQRWF